MESQRIRDDLLEALYWLSGERIEAAASAETLAPLMAAAAADLRPHLEALAGSGLVAVDEDEGGYRLTDEGRREAARRFAESFADIAGRQGHGACDDDCDCHTSAGAAHECAEERRTTHAHTS